MKVFFLTAVTVAALYYAVIPPAGAADSHEDIRRNPFERPVIEQAEVSPAARGGAKSAGNPGLRAVLAAGPRSIVNFGGVLLKIGESSNGYELLSVEEGTAVFRNKGKTVVFSLYEKDKEGSL